MVDDGLVPDAVYPVLPSPELERSLAVALDQWRFVGPWFRRGRIHRRCVAIMPLLAVSTLLTSKVMPLPTLAGLLCASPLCTDTGLVTARAYQSWTSWLRELHCGLYLARHGTVTKNPMEDLAAGIDLRFNGVALGIMHEGDRHFARKKRAGVVYLTATGGEGVHLVPESALRKLVMDARAVR